MFKNSCFFYFRSLGSALVSASCWTDLRPRPQSHVSYDVSTFWDSPFAVSFDPFFPIIFKVSSISNSSNERPLPLISKSVPHRLTCPHSPSRITMRRAGKFRIRNSVIRGCGALFSLKFEWTLGRLTAPIPNLLLRHLSQIYSQSFPFFRSFISSSVDIRWLGPEDLRLRRTLLRTHDGLNKTSLWCDTKWRSMYALSSMHFA